VTGGGKPILLVLDTSAILAYARSSIHVGETLTEVAADGGVTALPVLCLAEAWVKAQQAGLVEVLARHTDTRVVTSTKDWRKLSALYEVIGRHAEACAAQAAIDREVGVLTAKPERYGGLPDGGPVIPTW
jgi:hypothetical protein